MERYICIHGHFYQPPRENSWLEAIELQDSASPYHDWNERITAECYRPNSASRILDGHQRIVKIVNNYSRISFNFGPTLLTWLESKQPELYKRILDSDRESRDLFSGHSSAIAQGYNHIILPLANTRDKYTQIYWGMQDFVTRFGHMPEGMWLPETGVDLETLEILAMLGIRFTILAPHQAARIRKVNTRKWTEVIGGQVDPTMPYEIRLPSGRKLAVFFYDGPISRGIAFERLLTRGEDFAGRLFGAFSNERTHPQLVHIATDGETYGHHHSYGDMALAYALEFIEKSEFADLTVYGEYLEKHPPTWQAEILENTAWSCAHGVERWRSDCGCNSGGRPGWNQAWRTPLRAALDWLRDDLAPRFEELGKTLLINPWLARDDYVFVLLDRSPENFARFLERNAIRKLTLAEQTTVIKLLELQRHAMLMYTSCGWFFDELSGIETVQIIQYAGRAVQLAYELFGVDLEAPFLSRLALAKSNVPEHGDGREIYEQFVRPAMVDLPKVAAHYAATTLFDAHSDQADIYCYRVDRTDYQHLEAGRMKLAVGRATVTSKVTSDTEELAFACMHFGDHNLIGGVTTVQSDEGYATMLKSLVEAFNRADFPETILRLDQLGATTFSLRTLFRDEQRRILDRILESTLHSAEGAYRTIFDQHAPLMRFLSGLGVPLPSAFKTAAEFILNLDLSRQFQLKHPDPARIRALLREAETWDAQLDKVRLRYSMEQVLTELTDDFGREPESLTRVTELENVVDLARSVPFKVDLSRAQNRFYELRRQLNASSPNGHPDNPLWKLHYNALRDKLLISAE